MNSEATLILFTYLLIFYKYLINILLKIQEQDEWKEFEEEKKDYSGLKIGNLTISANSDVDESDSNTDQQQPQYDESGNEIEKKTGPWKRVDTEIAEKEEKKPVEQPPPPVTDNKYKPPNLRMQQPVQTRLRSSKMAPDIHNEEFFPTLSGSKSDRK